MAVRIIYQVFDKISIPIIGQGGISDIDDVIEFMMAGASAISVGTANMIEPAVSQKLVTDLEDYMKRESINSLKEITGVAH